MKNRWIITPAALAAIAAISYAAFIYLDPPALPDGVLYANGRIEGIEVKVSAEVTGRVVENYIHEGKEVDAGDLLVQIDATDFATRSEQAMANVAAILHELSSLTNERDTWRHHLETATENLNRLRELRGEDIVAQQQLEVAEDRKIEASGRVDALDARIAQTSARIEAANQDAELLRSQESKTRIVAPLTGAVLVKAVESGELVMPGQPVAVIVDMLKLELKTYIPESDLGKVRLGNDVRIRVDAFPDTYFEGALAQIDQYAQFTPKDVHMPEERARTVFGIVIAVTNDQGYLKPGMPADAWILWKDDMPWPETLPIPAM